MDFVLRDELIKTLEKYSDDDALKIELGQNKICIS